jgi:hypothetical protein
VQLTRLSFALGPPINALLVILDGVLRGAAQARFAWYEHLGDLAWLPVSSILVAQWSEHPAIVRGADLALLTKNRRHHLVLRAAGGRPGGYSGSISPHRQRPSL